MEKFDAAATSYDETFTHSSIGKKQRARVYHWFEKLKLDSSTKIFEINCGTGEDAAYFHQNGFTVWATDGSPKMVEAAKTKAKGDYPVYQLDFKEVAKNVNLANSNLLFSNFGGLNCLNPNNLNAFIQDLSIVQQKGDRCVIVLMSKYCLMEGLYHLFSLRWSKLWRRNTKTGVEVNVNGEMINTFYYLPSELRKMFGKEYEVLLQKPVALFLPPSYLEPFFLKHPNLLNLLNVLEGIFGSLSFFAKYSDHYLIAVRKR